MERMEAWQEESIWLGKGLEAGSEQNSTIHNTFKLGTIQMTVNIGMDKSRIFSKCNGIVNSNENAQTTTTWSKMDLISQIPCWEKEDIQNSTYYGFIYRKVKNRPNECMVLENRTGYLWGR